MTRTSGSRLEADIPSDLAQGQEGDTPPSWRASPDGPSIDARPTTDGTSELQADNASDALRRVFAVARNDARMMRRDPVPLIVMVVMPLVLIAFVRPIYGLALQHQGFQHTDGAQLAVPGLGVMFAFFLVNHTAYGIFREHGWRTWTRLRATPLRPVETVCGKAVPLLGFSLVQQAAVFLLGSLLFGLRMPLQRIPLWLLVAVPLGAALVAFGVALAAICRTVHQVNAFGNVATVLLGGVGGALVPAAQLPGWARDIAPATPTYWAVRGYRELVLGSGDAGVVLASAGVLAAFAAGLVAVAAARLRVEDEKVHWA